MAQTVFPLFKSTYSIGRSILTLESPDKVEANGPDSVFGLAKMRPDDRHFLVEDSISGVREALTNAAKAKLNFTFGLRLSFIEDASEKTEDSIKKESKIIVAVNNLAGYSDLIKLSTVASQDGFYYVPRVDIKMLKTIGTKNLTLMVPFYDSYIYRNNLETASAIPSFLPLFDSVFYCKEFNELPFDDLLSGLVDNAVKNTSNAEIINTQSIYYATPEDYLAYVAFRCIHNRTSLQKPNLEHMSSDTFCFDNYDSKA